MSGFEPSKNLSRVTATRALVLLSIFLFSAGPCLAGPGAKPVIMKAASPSLRLDDPIKQISPGALQSDGKLKMWYDKNNAPLKGRHIDLDLLSDDKGQNLIKRESTTKDFPPINNNNKRPNCSSMLDSSMPDHDSVRSLSHKITGRRQIVCPKFGAAHEAEHGLQDQSNSKIFWVGEDR